MSLVDNKKIHFNYEVLEKFEAGIELFGFEVKALRAGKASLEGSHVSIRGGEAFLVSTNIEPYQPKNTPTEYDPARSRKLLLNKKEIEELEKYEAEKGLTIVPISVYNKDSKLKLRIAVARGRKKYDKRAVMKERDTKREIDRTLKKR